MTSAELSEATEEQEITYTQEELETLISFVKEMTILRDLLPRDWRPVNDAAIVQWLENRSLPLLTIYFDPDGDLQCETDVPHGPITDFTYFLRELNHRFDVDNFHDTIIFGTLDSNYEGSMLDIIRDIYGPILLTSNNWPDSIL